MSKCFGVKLFPRNVTCQEAERIRVAFVFADKLGQEGHTLGENERLHRSIALVAQLRGWSRRCQRAATPDLSRCEHQSCHDPPPLRMLQFNVAQPYQTKYIPSDHLF
jgi:hypothetical protein